VADTKLIDLTAVGTPALEDLLYITDDPSGSPLDRKMTITQLQALISGMVLIEEQSPDGVSVVTFSSLGAYTHLELCWSARGDQVATSTVLNLTFNADGGANYDRENTSAAAATVSAAESLGATSAAIGSAAAASADAGMVGAGRLTIFDYRGTTYQKQGVGHSCLRRSTASGNILLQHHAIGWRSTAAITALAVTLASGNFVTSKFSLYGLK